MLIQNLQKRELISPPKFLPDNVIYMIWGGSHLYGTAKDNSDRDVVGICVPHKSDVFPHLQNEIIGFGNQKKRFEQWQQHHILDKDAHGGKGQEYDFCIYSIIKYFNLAMQNNPNTLEILFAPQEGIIHTTSVGQLIRDNRQLFLHKGSYHKYRGYAFSQKNKMKTQKREGKRKEDFEEFGYDRKFAMHLVRLMEECETILVDKTISFDKDKDLLREVRNGRYSLEWFDEYFDKKEIYLQKLYEKSSLPYGPDEEKIKELLLNCLELHYGSLDNTIKKFDKYEKVVRDIAKMVNQVI